MKIFSMIFKYEVLKQTRSEVTNPVPKATRVQNGVQNIRRKYGDRKNIMLHNIMLFSSNLQKPRFVIMHSLQQKKLLDIYEETFLKRVFKRCKELLTECLKVFG